MTTSRFVCLALVAVSGLTALACSGHAPPGHRQSGPPGPDKVVLCHKGKKTLQVAEAAAKAHYGHGDTPGPCR